VGKFFRKLLGSLGLYKRKGRWVVEQDFHGNFRSMLHGFLPFSPVSLTELCFIKTDDVTSGGRDMGPHG